MSAADVDRMILASAVADYEREQARKRAAAEARAPLERTRLAGVRDDRAAKRKAAKAQRRRNR